MIELDDELLEGKSPVMKIAFRMIIHAARDILYGRCEEQEVTQFIADVSPEKNGYYKEEDFVNTDEAMSILHLNKNRTKFFHLLKEYHIESKKISNMNVGYLRKEIIMLMNKLKEEAESISKVGRRNKDKYL